MGKKILVVVDYQYDFFSPDGALYVNGGEKFQEKIVNIIPNFDAHFLLYVFANELLLAAYCIIILDDGNDVRQ